MEILNIVHHEIKLIFQFFPYFFRKLFFFIYCKNYSEKPRPAVLLALLQVSNQVMLNRSKVKAVKMLLVVVVSFALSWMPLYAMVSRLRFGPPVSELEDELFAALLPFAQWLGTSNSCVNPIFYAYFNKKFRESFMKILSNHACCLGSRSV